MARYVTAGDANIDQLPRAYTKGHKPEPIGYRAGARCISENLVVTSAPKGGRPSIWIVEDHETYMVGDEPILGSVLTEVALGHCSLCSVQWGCARFAVACEEDFGTRSMPLEDLLWLRKQRNPEAIIRRAEADGRPMQFAVRDARTR